MDRDKFEHDLMGYLFDELDEVTTAAVKRKLDSDAACRELEAGLRAALQVSELTLEEPSDDLTERILAAAALAASGEPWHRRVARALAWAGSHAMRPQFAMAALLVLVLGSSLLLMRADPVATAIAPTIGPDTVDQNHEAASGRAGTAANRDRGEPDMPASESGRDRAEQDYKAGLFHYRAGRHQEAQKALGAVASIDHHRAPSAALYQARSVRAQSGCRDALNRYEGLRSRHPNTSAAEDAAWEQADCHRALGQTTRA
ncbi:MAG: zf-HC2 domain-containing protein, partial [Polyangiaceae bacterium]